MKNVLLLFGGNSSENLISCKSAKSILSNIDKNKYNVVSVYISLENKWYLFEEELEYIESKSWIKEELEIENISQFLKQFDVVFPIIHGTYGEDGKLQGMLSLFQIPFVGSKTTASSIGMDKEFSKMIFKELNIKQIPYICMHKNTINYYKILNTLKFPMIVKPANGGSSIGIQVAKDLPSLKKAIKEASIYDDKIIIEKFIKGRELECAVLENNTILTSSIGEILTNHEFYDYDAKYVKETQTVIPANIPPNLKKQIQKISKKVFQRLDCKNLARMDFLYEEKTNTLYLNEINTLPGFTTISMFPQLFIYDKIPYHKLIEILIENAHL